MPRRRNHGGLGSAARVARRAALALALALASLVGARSARAHNEDYTDLDIFQLSALSAEVTSVSGRAQRLLEAPAAVTVIDAEDIRRSGYTALPEILRMVPGIHVARVGTNVWAISARGFTNEFANKLLVLVDGRVIYTPTFSGVYWNLHDVPPEDIERIEVIRGPGATIWGTNAVNGVINVITKPASETQGDYVRALAGNEDRGIGSFRFGREVSPKFHYRVYGRGFARDKSVDKSGREVGDEWNSERLGFRADWENDNQSFTLDGAGFSSEAGTSVVTFPPAIFTNGIELYTRENDQMSGGHTLFRWRQQLAEGGAREFLAYYDQQHKRGLQYDDIRHSAMGNYQQELVPHGRHSIVWGASYRFTTNRISESVVLEPTHDARTNVFWASFLQDEITIVPEKLKLDVGSKVEWNDLARWEIQPSLRLMYTPRDNHQLWMALSRATRSPSNVERDVTIRLGVVNPGILGPNAIQFGILPDPDFESEVLLASELGYRWQPRPTLAFDLAAFYNDYQNLRDTQMRVAPVLLVPITNNANGRSIGGEASIDWRASAWWGLTASYQVIHTEISGSGQEEHVAPSDRWQLRSSFDLPGNVELDTTVEYTGAITSFPGAAIPRYFRCDARAAWKPMPALELSLVGQNLTDRQHQEWSYLLGGDRNVELQRSVYAQAVWSF